MKSKRQKNFEQALLFLASRVKVSPLKNGAILCELGDPKTGAVTFTINPKIICDAAEAGIKFLEELNKHHEAGAGATELAERYKEASSQPLGGE